ncbi:MAG TPA: hypothetical protein VFQ88_16430 [Nevskiaceae bacterium]|nr:hypothetical protein [Nevskiaceae bacterium]
MKIAVQHTAHFAVGKAVDAVFAVLEDVPRAISYFPGLDALVPLGDNRYRWDMTPISLMRFSHQVVYACQYVNDADRLGLQWIPVQGVGNSTIRGGWRLAATAGGGTTVDFTTSGELDVPFPEMLRKLATKVVTVRFRGMVEQYHINLQRAIEA